MEDLYKLYDSFGELLYVVAMADGVIQEEEYRELEQKLKKHPWGREILWSFNYERSNNRPVEELYSKVLSYCQELGPRKEYKFLIELINQVAEADGRVEDRERAIVKGFAQDLMTRFEADLKQMLHLD